MFAFSFSPEYCITWVFLSFSLDLAVSGLTLFSFAGFILLTNETEWGHTGKKCSQDFDN